MVITTPRWWWRHAKSDVTMSVSFRYLAGAHLFASWLESVGCPEQGRAVDVLVDGYRLPMCIICGTHMYGHCPFLVLQMLRLVAVPSARDIYMRDRFSKTYQALPYYIATVFVDIPIQVTTF